MMSSLREKCASLLSAHSSNHEIALGLAVGVCVSFFPVYGPQIPACLLLVLIFKNLNKVAVLLGVQFSWLYPVVVYLDYQAGRLVWPWSHAALSLPPLSEIRERGFGFLCAHLATMVKELLPMMLAGSVLAGAAAGALTYFIALLLLGMFRKKML
jgi:uncharacterized protein (DUF2062 family)